MMYFHIRADFYTQTVRDSVPRSQNGVHFRDVRTIWGQQVKTTGTSAVAQRIILIWNANWKNRERETPFCHGNSLRRETPFCHGNPLRRETPFCHGAFDIYTACIHMYAHNCHQNGCMCTKHLYVPHTYFLCMTGACKLPSWISASPKNSCSRTQYVLRACRASLSCSVVPKKCTLSCSVCCFFSFFLF